MSTTVESTHDVSHDYSFLNYTPAKKVLRNKLKKDKPLSTYTDTEYENCRFGGMLDIDDDDYGLTFNTEDKLRLFYKNQQYTKYDQRYSDYELILNNIWKKD